MDRRYVEAWERLRARRASGEPLPAILRGCGSADLVAALAGAGRDDAVAANAIATELLNRQVRAPFFGAFLVSATVVLGIFVTDYLDTGTAFFLEGGARASLLAVVSGAAAVFSLLVYRLWRGSLPGLRMRLMRFRRHRPF
jgi:hypothetical protein